MKYLTLLPAIKDSLISIYQLRIRPLLTWKLLIIALIVAAVALMTATMVSSHLEANYQKREQGREAERQEIAQETDFLRAAANKATIQAAELERQNRKLAAEADDLRRQIAAIGEQYAQNGKVYATKKAEYETITDFTTLRRLNCERRKLLGYPCPEQ